MKQKNVPILEFIETKKEINNQVSLSNILFSSLFTMAMPMPSSM